MENEPDNARQSWTDFCANNETGSVSGLKLANIEARRRFQETYQNQGMNATVAGIRHRVMAFFICAFIACSAFVFIAGLGYAGTGSQGNVFFGLLLIDASFVFAFSILLYIDMQSHAIDKISRSQIIECPECGVRIEASKPWYCRACDTAISDQTTVDTGEKERYILAGCPKCQHPTPAVECPSCSEHIILIADGEFHSDRVAYFLDAEQYEKRSLKMGRDKRRQKPNTPEEKRHSERRKKVERWRSLSAELADETIALEQVLREIQEDCAMTDDMKDWISEQLRSRRRSEMDM